jgi:hypothetical protein
VALIAGRAEHRRLPSKVGVDVAPSTIEVSRLVTWRRIPRTMRALATDDAWRVSGRAGEHESLDIQKPRPFESGGQVVAIFAPPITWIGSGLVVTQHMSYNPTPNFR